MKTAEDIIKGRMKRINAIYITDLTTQDIVDMMKEYAQQEVKNTIKEVVKAQLIDAGQEGYKRGYEDGSEGLEPMKYDYVKENIV